MQTNIQNGNSKTATSRLSETQKAVWTYCHVHRGTPAYHICMRFGPFPDLDIQRLKAATELAVNNHPIVKARLTTDNDGEPLMVRHDEEPPFVETIVTTDNEEDETLNRFCIPLDYDGGRLYRLLILKTESGVSLLANFHHTVFDGISMNILLGDITDAYAGMPLQPETDDLFDVARKESERRTIADYEAARQWHETTFPKTALRSMPPADKYDASEPMPTFEIFPTSITTEHWDAICQKAGQSANIVSLTAFALFLGCFTGEDEVRFSTVFHGRHGKSMQRTVGMLVQTIPVAARWNGETRVSNLMHDIRWQQARCMVNDIHPFSEVRKLCGGFGEVNFIYQGNTQPQQQFCGYPLKKKFIMPNMSGSALAMELWFECGRLDLYVEYNTAIYSREIVVKMAKCFEHVLCNIAEADTVGDIRFADNETMALLETFNDTKNAPSSPKNIIELFRHWAKVAPDAIAVCDERNRLSYAELNERSDRLAALLKSSGAGRGSVVALLLPRDISMPLCTLAVLKSGAAYLPCSAASPDAVISEQWLDAEAEILVTTSNLKHRTGQFKGTILTLDENDYHIEHLSEEALSNVNICPNDLFALFYTSGSTGKSKAVRITHGNVAAYCHWYREYFQPHEGTVIGAYNAFAFDASVTDMFTTLSSGATLAIIPERLKKDIRAVAEYVDSQQIEIIDLPTQIGRLFAMHERCNTLRHIVLGGEAVTPFKACHDYNIYNQYGPTEATVAVTIYHIQGNEKYIPIGKAITGAQLYVVDSHGRRAPIGAPGELWIAGSQVSEGYHKRPKETAEAFTDNPFCKEKPFDRVFRTGDIVRYRNDGTLEFLGRKDGMVKIRGFRVELGAVEAALRNCSGVEEAAATTFADANGAMQIAAFLVAQKPLDFAATRQEMLTRVPSAMVPLTMQQIDTLPLTTTGKVDRKALPKPEIAVDDDYTEPQNATESIICEAFANVLGKERMGAETDFFVAGGTSITAVHVLMQLEKHGIDVQYADIYGHPTARQLAKWVDSEKKEESHDIADDDFTTLQKAISEGNKACLGSNERVPLHDVLLTGATGFLGIHILADLLTQNINKVWCVVRRTGEETANEKLLGVMHHYFGTKHDTRFAECVETVEGDLTMAATFQRLETIESRDLTVINCAAIVKHFAPKDMMERINVDAVRRLADFCSRHNARMTHISTLNTVMPTTEKQHPEGQYITEATFTPLPSTANPYTTTKWEAERLLLNDAGRGAKVKIMRMGNLSPRLSDGMLQKGFEQNAALNWMRIIALTRCCPQSYMDVPVEFTPVDVAAQTVVLLSETPASGNVFHVFCPPKLRVADVISAMKQCGINVETTSEEAFAQRLHDLLNDERAGQSLAVARETLSFGAPSFCWNNDFTLKVIANLDHSMPKLPSDYIKGIIKQLAGNRFF